MYAGLFLEQTIVMSLMNFKHYIQNFHVYVVLMAEIILPITHIK
jgi:hypothetical protein